MNKQNIIVFDFETGGLDPMVNPPIQIAGMVINPRTLEPLPNSTYSKMMRPSEEDYKNVTDDALRINKKTREQILAAPPEELVWKEFATFCQKYKVGPRPAIPCGKNIRTFDMAYVRRLCKKYGFWDKKRQTQNIFDERVQLDLDDYLFSWFESNDELENFRMDTVRPYFGITNEGGHDALQDVRDTWALMSKFLKLHRTLSKRISFKGALANGSPSV
jgi:DNA polymerase III epsilon subunit-like protein